MQIYIPGLIKSLILLFVFSKHQLLITSAASLFLAKSKVSHAERKYNLVNSINVFFTSTIFEVKTLFATFKSTS